MSPARSNTNWLKRRSVTWQSAGKLAEPVPAAWKTSCPRNKSSRAFYRYHRPVRLHCAVNDGGLKHARSVKTTETQLSSHSVPFKSVRQAGSRCQALPAKLQGRRLMAVTPPGGH